MLIYIFSIAIFSFASISEIINLGSRNIRAFLSILSLLFVIGEIGLRWETGTDWLAYLVQFHEATSPFKNVPGYSFEPGYNFIVYCAHLLSINYSLFLFIHATFIFCVFFWSARRLTTYPTTATLLFYVESIGLTGSNRQFIALVICIGATRYILERKPSNFFSLVFLASLIHASAIIFAITYFLRSRVKTPWLVAILFLSYLLGQTSAPEHVLRVAGMLIGGHIQNKDLHYLNAAIWANQTGFTVLGAAKRITLLGIFLAVRGKFRVRHQLFELSLNIYLFGIVLYLLFGESLPAFSSRGTLYFFIFDVFLLTNSISLLRGNRQRLIVSALLPAYCAAIFFSSISLYPALFVPYKGVFIDSTVIRKNLY